jgi:L-ascorbate metabolism protein UlaG (beta-lactamase superfamily)
VFFGPLSCGRQERQAEVMATIENALLVGGPTLRFDYAGRTWLTDPTFDEPRDYHLGERVLHKLTGPAVAPDDLGPVDVVLLSHDQHKDNLDDAGREWLTSVATVLSTPEAASRMAAVRGLAPWETTTVGDVTVTAVPALHGPEGADEILGTVTGFLLSAPDRPTVYFSGDNASVALVERIVARSGPIGVAILNVGAANPELFGDSDVTLNARTAVLAARALGDATIVPIHAEGWHHFSETLDRLVRSFRYAGLADRLHTLKPAVPEAI